MSIAIFIFISTYLFIVFGIIHRTLAALIGAVAMLALGVLGPEEAFYAIDFDTVGILVGMMTIVGITRKTGVFEFLAIKAAQRLRPGPLKYSLQYA
ncbi:hypothetical protein N752_03420 [Desulforamulus aquiferis]|nr:SLC13 family permease [Desulforamulus aquiferis]RYD06738.1 hypothetical protein N752_03420 [Desulforamulus aquiferis]